MLLARLPLLFAILLCIALAGAFYLQLSPLFLDDGQNPSNSLSTQKSASVSPIARKKIHNVASFQLFGNSNAVPKKVIQEVKDLPKTKLKLTLTGVLASKENEVASALIEGPNKDTISYKIEDELPGGAILKQVLADRVILERSGKLENLFFVETKSIGIESYTHIDDDESQNNVIQKVKSPFPQHEPRNAPISPQRTLGIKERLGKLRKRILKNRP